MSTGLSIQEQTALALRMWAVVEYIAFAATVRNMEVGLGLEVGCCADVQVEMLQENIVELRHSVQRPPLVISDN
jgi:hypothetical protein